MSRLLRLPVTALTALALALVMGPGCLGGVEDEDRPEVLPVTAPEDVGEITAELSAADVLARARSWVNVGMPYCGGTNGGSDSICGGKCTRTGAANNPEWNPYRSDCSGLVSYSWGLPAPGLDTGSMGAIANKGTGAFTRVDISALQPGDALITTTKGHTFLFAGWVVPMKKLKLIEEYDCGKVAREVDRDVTISGNTLKKTGDSRPYLAAHLKSMIAGPPPPPPPPANKAPQGYLDNASCDAGIDGWAQDPDAPSASIEVHLYLDGPAGQGRGVKLDASRSRDDLCAAIGSCNHGFAYRMPRSLFDGKDHTVHAYGIDATGGSNPLLGNAPKTFTCAKAMPAGERRWITNMDSLGAWKLDRFESEMPVSPAEADAIPLGTDVPAAPVLWKGVGEARVWLIDSGFKRGVPNPDAMAAWHFAWGSIVEKPAAEIAALPEGPLVRQAPVMVAADSQGRLTLLDDALPKLPAPPTPGIGGSNAGTAGTGGSASAGAGGSDDDGNGTGPDLPSPDDDGSAIDPGSTTYEDGPFTPVGGSAGAAGKRTAPEPPRVAGSDESAESGCSTSNRRDARLSPLLLLGLAMFWRRRFAPKTNAKKRRGKGKEE